MTETLQELFDSRGVRMGVDRHSGVIRGVKILGLESRNGRTYLPEALAAAAPLYEGAKVNVNHPKGGPAGPRDYQDRIGVIRSVKAGGDGLFADFHFNPKHALAEQLVWDAEHAPENVGFSHNVEARTTRRGDRVVVEAITRVQSVDLVADPATTRGLFEAEAGPRRARPFVRAPTEGWSGERSGRSRAAHAGGPEAGLSAIGRGDCRRAGRRVAAAGGGSGPADPGRVAPSEAQGGAAVAPRIPPARGRFRRSPGGGRHQPAIHRIAAGGAGPGGDAASWSRSGRGWSSRWAAGRPRAADGPRPRSRDQHLADGVEACDARAFAEAITGT